MPTDKIFHAINKSKTDEAIRNWAGGEVQYSRRSTQPGLGPQDKRREGRRRIREGEREEEVRNNF